ncbi:MAG TPA: hypothetical protein DHV29_02825, partial [Bacteroidales bacterium]|nr:hypothetical protein [Bacteroidales bacterium]
SRPRPWQGRALPTELLPHFGLQIYNHFFIRKKIFTEIFTPLYKIFRPLLSFTFLLNPLKFIE